MVDIRSKKNHLRALIDARRKNDQPISLKPSSSTVCDAYSPVAIIGMAGMFPQSPDKETFWEHLSQDRTLIQRWPEERAALFDDHDDQCAPWGGFMLDVKGFDAQFFNLPKGEAELIDPQLRKLLMSVYHTIEDAGYAPGGLRGSQTGVFIGFEQNDYGQRLSEQGVDTGNGLYQSASMIANQVSYVFDFRGPSDVINAMCASGAVAIHRAVSALRRGEIEQAIVGAVNIMLRAETFIQLGKTGQLSAGEQVHSFGKQADGYLRGEGVSSLLLKPLDKAVAEGDSIYAVIKNTAVNYNGSGGTSIAAPDVAVHSQLIQTCYRQVGVDPRQVSYIEAQGMGNQVADIAEWNAFNDALKALAREQNLSLPARYCAVSTLKPMTGHMHANAALGAVFKVVHSLTTRRMHKIIGLQEVNPFLDREEQPCYLLESTQTWPQQSGPRLAGIHAWGSGGNNAHLLIEEYRPAAPKAVTPQGLYHLPISAPDTARLVTQVKKIAAFVHDHPAIDFADIAFTLQQGRDCHAQRVLFVCRDREHWLQQAASWVEDPTQQPPLSGVFTQAECDAPACPPEGKRWLETEPLSWRQGGRREQAFSRSAAGHRVHLPGTEFACQPYWLDGNALSQPRRSFAQLQTAASYREREKIAHAVTEVLSDYLGVSAVALDRHADFSELGFNSLMVSNVVARLNSKYQINLEPATFFACRTPEALIEHLTPQKTPHSVHRREQRAGSDEDIAIIGIVGRYPHAANLAALWDNLSQGRTAIVEVPPQRWPLENFYCADRKTAIESGKSYGKWGAFLDDLHGFDAAFFNISPREATFMHPKERLVMQSAWHVLEDAGYTPESLAGQRVGVFIGVSKVGLDNYLDSYFSIANRVSYKFNFTGISLPIDTACSSSLTAVHEACLHLQCGECDVALVGGVNAYTHPSAFITFSSLNVISASGRCAAFAEEADGFVPGEGVGTLLLKPLRAALRDRDQIHAIIRGSAANHGGKANGYTVPNPKAQQQLIVDAMQKARVNASDISYVEAHGTGTVLGDPIEISGLTQAFAERGGKAGSCALGSLKPNIGHLEAAAGIAGLTKAVLQMKHQQLAPSLYAERLNPQIDFASGPFEVVQQLTPWRAAEYQPRIAAVSSFGAGGSNAHVILAEGIARETLPATEDVPALFLLSARSANALARYARDYIAFLTTNRVNFSDLIFTLQVGRQAMEHRLALLVRNQDELLECLESFCQDKTDSRCYRSQADARNGHGASRALQLFAQSEEAKQLLQGWYQQQQFTWLAQLWVDGAEIDWLALNRQSEAHRISLPLYPFEMEQFEPAPLVWPQEPAPAHAVPQPRTAAPTTEPVQFYLPQWQEEAVPATGHTTFAIHRVLCLGVKVSLDGAETVDLLADMTAAEQARADLTFSGLCRTLLQHLQTLMHRAAKTPQQKVKLQLVCDGQRFPFVGGLTGLLRTAEQEWPMLSVQLVELNGMAPANLPSRLRLDAGATLEHRIRYQDGTRLVWRWQARQGLPAPASFTWRRHGVYLITGGLGSIGRRLAETIVEQGEGCRVHLLGRSALTAQQRDWLKVLEKRGAQLVWHQGDVTDTRILENIRQRLKADGGALHGIIHCAGVIRDDFISRKDLAQVSAVCAPKVTGTFLLDQTFADFALDFFVCFSSASSVAGHPAQADYAAANGFMDSYVYYRNELVMKGERHGKSMSLNWGLWQSEGMQLPPAMVMQLWQTTGMQPVDMTQGVAALRQSLAAGYPQVMLIQGSAERLRQHLVRLKVLPALADVQPDAERWLCRQVARLLNVGEQDLDSRLTFAELGFAANEYRQLLGAIQQEWNEGITLAALSECPDLQSAAALLLREKGETAGPLQADSASDALESVCALLKTILSQATQLDETRIDIHAPLEKYGIDSLLIMRMSDSLSERFGSLPRTLFYEYQTLHALAQYLVQHHGAQLQRYVAATSAQAHNSLPQDSTRDVVPTARQPVSRSDESTDIAIIGLAGRYPQANTMEEFWQVLSEGRDCISEIPLERWDHSRYYSPERQKPGKTYAKWGGFIDDVDKFDPQFFNMSPKEAQRIEPQERLFLQCAYEVIQDAGYTPASLNRRADGLARVGVYVGVTYQEYQLYGAEQTLLGNPMVLSMSSASIANRVSWFCNFTGPSIAIDTMCASSLTSIHLACQSLLTGESHLAIAGGVNVSIHPAKYLMLGYGGFASEKGRCHSFGADGDGYVPSEGVGAVLLKPLAQAEKDGDHIYGVIKASVVNHGGRTHGYSVPNPAAQAALITQALEKANLPADAIGYVEAHGTGTPLGDPIEIRALDQAFRQAGRQRAGCAIGSVKSTIGHCESAAGIAGLTRVLLQFKHRKLAPSLHAATLNPNIDFTDSLFSVQTKLQEWQPAADLDVPLAAGISSFGAGGANAHLIVTEYVPTRATEQDEAFSQWLIPLSARTPEQLREWVQRFLSWLTRCAPSESDLTHISWTLQVGREPMLCRLGLVVNSIAALKEKLELWLRSGNTCDGMYCVNHDELPSEPAAQPIPAGEGQLLDVLREWIAGKLIDWSPLYRGKRVRRVSLPLYPFGKTRCWWNSEVSPRVVQQPPSTAPSRVLPFLVGEDRKIVLRDPATVFAQQQPVAEVTVGIATGDALSEPAAQSHSATPPQMQTVADPAPAATARAATPELLEQLKQSLAQALYLAPDEIAPARKFTQIGLDSIIGVEWIREVNKTFALSLPANTVYQHACLLDFADYLASCLTPVPAESAAQSCERSENVLAREEDPGLIDELRNSLAKALYLEPAEISATRKFTELGLDSIIGVEWIREINAKFGVSLPANIVYKYPTLTSFSAYLATQLPQARAPLSVDQILEMISAGTMEPEEGEALLQNHSAVALTDE